MKKLLLLIFSIILLSSCYEKEREVDISKKQERNGIVYIINESKPYSGKILRKYDNGQILLLMSYKNGKLDGKYLHFYRNGQIYIDSEYKDGKLNGLYKKHHHNGQVLLEANYIAGELNGIYLEHSKEGEKTKEIKYDKGNILEIIQE